MVAFVPVTVEALAALPTAPLAGPVPAFAVTTGLCETFSLTPADDEEAERTALLLAVGGYAAVEGVRRLIDPPEVPGPELLFFGVIGLVANVISMSILFGERADHTRSMLTMQFS